MYIVLDVLIVELTTQEIVVNVVRVEKPEYSSELTSCHCGNIIPSPVRYQDNPSRFKLLVETSGSFNLDKVYRFPNSNLGFDTFAKSLISNIITRKPLIVTSSLFLIFNYLINDGRRVTIDRLCQGCFEANPDN